MAEPHQTGPKLVISGMGTEVKSVKAVIIVMFGCTGTAVMGVATVAGMRVLAVPTKQGPVRYQAWPSIH